MERGAILDQRVLHFPYANVNLILDRKNMMSSKLILIVSLSLFTTCATAQNNSGKLEIVFFPGIEVREGIFFKTDSSEPYTGSTKSTYDNGNPYVTASFEDGRLDGAYTAYYANGQKMGVSHYKHGIKHGESIAWHENGQMASRVKFVKGKKEGPMEMFYQTGQQSVEAFFKAGKLDSTFTQWKATGELHSIEIYDEGEPVEEANKL